MGYGGIDFAPQPAPGSNPFEPVVEGINLGFGIQQQMREQQKFQADQLAAQAAAQAAKDKAEMERGEKGLAYLKEFGKDLSPETKTKVIRESVIPLANKMYGLDIDPATIDYKDDYANLLKLMSNKAPAELVKEEYALLVSRANSESLPVIKELGDTIGFDDKSSLQQQRLTNLEQERDSRRLDLQKGRYRQYLLDIEQRDPIIKKINEQNLNVGTLSGLQDLVAEGNTVAFSGVGIKMAKAMGEVGVMTETDIKRYVTSGQLGQGAGDTLLKWLKGKPTDATLSEMNQISNVLQDSYAQKLQPRIDKFVNSFSKIEGISPEEFAAGIGVSYSGSAPKIPKINTQAEYDKLPAGAEYLDSDGVKARKQ